MKNQSAHARSVVDRFRQMLLESGDTLNDEHADELALLIESALDAALLDQLETMAVELEKIAHDMRHDEQFFS